MRNAGLEEAQAGITHIQPTSKFYWLLHQCMHRIWSLLYHHCLPTLGILISCLDLPAVFLFMPWTHSSHFLTHWSLWSPLKTRGRCCHFFPQNPLWVSHLMWVEHEITRRFYKFCHCLHFNHTGLLSVPRTVSGSVFFLFSFFVLLHL